MPTSTTTTQTQGRHLFPRFARRVAAFARDNPSAKIIRMGIGDVTEPPPPP